MKKDDKKRRKSSLYFYGIDTSDVDLYDVVQNIDNIKVNDALNILVYIVKYPCFQATFESKARLNDLLLIEKIKAALADNFPNVDFQGSLSHEEKIAA